MVMKINKPNKKLSLPLIIIAILLFVGVAAVGAYYYSTSKNTEPAESSGINYNPPTEQEIESSQDGKKNSAEQEPEPTQNNSTNKKTVNVGISYSDVYGENLEIRAFTNSTIEGDGTCTATVTKNGATITKKTEAFIDASSTQCKPIYIPSSELESGTWKINVKFSSSDAEGTSGDVEVEIK